MIIYNLTIVKLSNNLSLLHLIMQVDLLINIKESSNEKNHSHGNFDVYFNKDYSTKCK